MGASFRRDENQEKTRLRRDRFALGIIRGLRIKGNLRRSESSPSKGVRYSRINGNPRRFRVDVKTTRTTAKS